MKPLYMIAMAPLAMTNPALAQTTDIADLYRGKTVTFMINFTPGGSTDVEGRVLARHLGNHIPGKPAVVVQNMGGAGGSIGTNYLGQVAKADGLTMGYLTASVGKQALGEADLKVDLKGLEFLGNVPDVNVTYMRTDVKPGIATPADIMKTKGFWIGGLTPDSPKDLAERLQLEMLGLEFRYLSGYKGSPEARLAVQQNEIQFYNEGLASYRAAIEPGIVKNGTVIPVWYDPLEDGDKLIAAPAAAGIPARPFHEFYESVKGPGSLPTDLRWQAYMRINQLSTSFLRVLMMPPKAPPAAVAAMRQALVDTFADPAYQADAKQTFNNVPEFKTGEVQKKVLLAVLAPRPGVQEFIADYIAKGFRSVGEKK
jgi:tripartite-type tricarboxylate transporter receptor subunit TctC